MIVTVLCCWLPPAHEINYGSNSHGSLCGVYENARQHSCIQVRCYGGLSKCKPKTEKWRLVKAVTKVTPASQLRHAHRIAQD